MSQTLEEVASSGGNIAFYIAIVGVIVALILIVGGLNLFAFLRKNRKEFSEMRDEWLKEAMEKRDLEEKLKKLDRWTGNQQDDIEDHNEGLVILARTQAAILDHIIVKQEGNGKCHAAQKEVDEYLKKKSMAKKSHK